MAYSKPIRQLSLLTFCLLALSGLPVLAQFGNGPNAGALQSQMMGPIRDRYHGNIDLWGGPLSPASQGKSPKGYENPIIMEDGHVRGLILPKQSGARPTLPPTD
jgi:hypothetical protein